MSISAGNMDTCIALRTMVMLGQTAYVQAGAGIVADSVPASEYQESREQGEGLVPRRRGSPPLCQRG